MSTPDAMVGATKVISAVDKTAGDETGFYSWGTGDPNYGGAYPESPANSGITAPDGVSSTDLHGQYAIDTTGALWSYGSDGWEDEGWPQITATTRPDERCQS